MCWRLEQWVQLDLQCTIRVTAPRISRNEKSRPDAGNDDHFTRVNDFLPDAFVDNIQKHRNRSSLPMLRRQSARPAPVRFKLASHLQVPDPMDKPAALRRNKISKSYY